MDAVVASIVGVGVGAIVTIATQLMTSRRERRQWERQKAYDSEKWIRDKIQEIYSNCFYYEGELHYYIDDKIQKQSLLEYTKLMAERTKLQITHNQERRRWLNLLAVYHPFQDNEEYDQFCEWYVMES